MMTKFSFSILLACLFIVSSCQHKVDGVPIDEELEPYFETFRVEAEKRGVIFDNSVEQIEGYIQNIVDGGVIGACKRNADNEDSPQIFFDKPYWRSATELQREYVLFHELGHCFLKLGHDDSQNANGECVSIMASGTTGCRDNYNSMTRDSLINELFAK